MKLSKEKSVVPNWEIKRKARDGAKCCKGSSGCSSKKYQDFSSVRIVMHWDGLSVYSDAALSLKNCKCRARNLLSVTHERTARQSIS